MVIAKMMNQWILRHVLIPTVFRSFDQDVNNRIEAQRRMLWQGMHSLPPPPASDAKFTTDTPNSVRYMALSTMANELRMLQGRAGFENCFMDVARQNGNLLFNVLTPLRYGNSARTWDDMYELIQSAHRLALAMYTSGNEYRFDFPQANDPYDPHHMINRNHRPLAIGVTQCYVSLSASPRVTMRTLSDGAKEAHIRKADVLVKSEIGC